MTPAENSNGEIYNIIVGTAGHIDHGKSSLVQHLTGIDPDRLPEERDRGLTIDLGFAPMKLTTGETIGIIDVPGHERFIKNMVAGASAIDLVVLVVAADDSVMPQTREHLDIMTLLGVRRGLIAINKIDLVDSDMVELVGEEISETVAGTFLEDAPVIKVSAQTGEGIEELRKTVESHVMDLPSRDEGGVFRMPIQRVFSAKGHGTVVTGVPTSGHVEAGDRLEILPLSETGRVRGLQAYKISVDRARAGHSTAINLTDIDYRSVQRGMVAATPGYFRSTSMIEVRLRALGGIRAPLYSQMPVRFHSGTSEEVGKLYLLDCKTLTGGEEALAQVRLASPVIVAPGDRYVIRQESPMVTLGGGEILDRSRWRLKTGKDHVIDALSRKEAALGSPEEYIASVAMEDPFQKISVDELSRRAALEKEEVKEHLDQLVEKGVVCVYRSGGYFSSEGLERGGKRVIDALEKAFRTDPYRVYIPTLELKDRVRLEGPFLDALLENMDEEGSVEVLRGGRVALCGREISLPDAQQEFLDQLQEHYLEQLFSPERIEVLANSLAADFGTLEKLQSLLIDQGVLVRITPEVILHSASIVEGAKRLEELFSRVGPFTAADAKDALETTRKFAIPLLEHLDRLGRTRRVGDRREFREDEAAGSGS